MSLQPFAEHNGAEIPLQPMEGPEVGVGRCLKELWEPCGHRLFPAPCGRDHVGAVHEKLHPVGRTHIGIHGGVSHIAGTPTRAGNE